MDSVLATAALARRLQRSELWALEAFVAIVAECASEKIRAGKNPHHAYRHALNETLDLVRAGLRRKEYPHHD